MDLQGKTAVITGGASGIGAATARRLAGEGVRVAILDRNGDGAAAVAHNLPDATAHAVYVADPDAVDRAFDAVLAPDEGLDILMNCAGIGTTNTLENMPLEDWRRVIDINLSGPFYCLQRALPALKVGGARNAATGGSSVINIASIAGKRISYHGGVNYTASKAGLLGLTRHAAFELAPLNVRVNAICPGPVMTPMVQATSTPAEMEKAAATIPLGRWVQPEQVADMVLFLAGPGSAMCTGASFDVDGGVLVSNGTPYSAYKARRGEGVEARDGSSGGNSGAT